MLTGFRRRLGRIKEKLERRVENMSSGKASTDLPPISDEDKDFMLEWITGRVDDQAVVDRAHAHADGHSFIKRVCTARPANARMCAVRAQFCLEEGEVDEALAHAEHAFWLGRHEPEVGLVLVRARIAAGRRDEALEAVSVTLGNARRKNAHAIRLEVCGLWQGLAPDSIEPLLEAARTHVASGDLETGIAEFGKLRDKFGPRVDILLPLAAIYQDLVRTEDALAVCLQAVEVSPDDVDALCMAGGCARDLSDNATADRLLSRAFEIDPGSQFAQYNLGLLRLDQDRIDEAAELTLGARASSRGVPWTEESFAARLAAPVEWNVADVEWANATFKIVHDIEQLEYLRDRNIGGTALEPVLEEYRTVLRDPLLPKEIYSMVALDPGKYPLLARTYKAPLCAPDPEPPAGPLLNPDLAWGEIEEQYLDAKPSLVFIDDLLAPEALASLRAFCLESTIWNQLKGGYLGAYMPDGFSGRLLLRIASELRAKMPRVIRKHPLQTMWAYKYDSQYAGIGVHADVAAVNVNFWITPDEANLAPDSGGLVVYTHDAPRDWDFQRFNSGHGEIYAYLESVGAKKVTVPYRANRAVIFDSDLFHETDAFRFRKGYANRRVNVTMLYGTRAG